MLRVALCQLDLTVGALRSNVAAMADAYRTAEAAGCDVALFPELATCGYPPEDLLLKPGFIADAAALDSLAAQVTRHCAAVVGWVEGHRTPGADPHDSTDGPWNAAAVLHDGEGARQRYHKQALPNYGVFDEKRYFDPRSAGQPLFRIAGVLAAVTVCEDLWVPAGPAPGLTRRGAHVVLNINVALPRRQAGVARVDAARPPGRVLGADRGGQPGRGQDELVFDGGSFVVDRGESRPGPVASTSRCSWSPSM